MSLMKRILVLMFVALLLFAGGITLWLQTPPIQDPETVEAARASHSERFTVRRKLASGPETNGYLHPKLVELWGVNHPDDGPLEKRLKAWNEFSTISQKEPVEHHALLQQKDEAYLKARSQFATIYPDLREAASKKAFLVPAERRSLDIEVPDVLNLRAAVAGLTGYAESLLAEGRTKEALEALETGWRLGYLQSGDGMLGDMIGVSLQSSCTDAFCHLFGPRSDLTAEQWTRLSARLVDYKPSSQQLTYAVENEMAALENLMEDIIAGRPVAGQQTTGISYAPVLIQRERRMMLNRMAETLKQVKDGSISQTDGSTEKFSWPGWFSGRTGMLSSMVAQNWDRASAQISLNRAKLTGLSTACGLLAYRAKHDRLPDNLEALEGLGLKSPQEFPWEPAFDYQPEAQSLTLQVPAELIAGTRAAGDRSAFARPGWLNVTTDALVFDLKR